MNPQDAVPHIGIGLVLKLVLCHAVLCCAVLCCAVCRDAKKMVQPGRVQNLNKEGAFRYKKMYADPASAKVSTGPVLAGPLWHT
jgi:hypothetical protein